MTDSLKQIPVFEAKKLSRTYHLEGVEVKALSEVDLVVLSGEFVAIMGASGSGKSTLMHLMGCLDTPDSGDLIFEGKNIRSLDKDQLAELRNSRIGFVFQDFNLLERATALENVEMPLIYLGLSGRERKKRALAALEAVGLLGRANHFPVQLSGGEQQRVAIARALVTKPSVILADEPTGNLDSNNGREIMRLFQGLHAEGITIVLITHDRAVADFALRTVQLSDGIITQDITHRQPSAVKPGDEKVTDAIHRSKPQPKTWRFLFYPGWLGYFFTAIRIGMQALARNPFRSLLTTLGIIIGVGSVLTISGIGKNFYLVFQHQIFKLAKNLVFVRPMYRHRLGGKNYMGTITEGDAASIEQICQNALTVVPKESSGGTIVFVERYCFTTIYGTSEHYLDVSGGEIEKGHFITPFEIRSAAKVCVIGQGVVAELFPDRDPIGKKVEINRVPFEIIGVLKPMSGNLGKIFSGVEREVMVPLSTFKRRLSRSRKNALELEEIIILADSTKSMGIISRQVIEILRFRHGISKDQGNDFYVRNTEEIALMVGMMLTSIIAFIAGIASISLLVGGIGIMNIMLVSVTERTREIGIRMAIGAKRGDILRQFLIESMTLSALGGGLGILGGLSCAFVGQTLMESLAIGFCNFDLPAFLEVVSRFSRYPLISLALILAALGFSTTIGIFFGLYPAYKASRLDPIRALRTL